MQTAIILAGHGSVESLEDLPTFLTNIRRGHAPTPELLKEVTHRYELIGGSPLLPLSRSLASKLSVVSKHPVRIAMRMWKPYAEEAVRELSGLGAKRIVVLALAQYSSSIYGDMVREAVTALGAGENAPAVDVVPNWGVEEGYIRAVGSRIAASLTALVQSGVCHEKIGLVLSAHSLPTSVVAAGDTYETEFRATTDTLKAYLKTQGMETPSFVAFQSQGMSKGPGGRPIEWLGPDLASTIAKGKADGLEALLFAPIGFLADHVEILYDLDIEAQTMCKANGITYARVPSLNDADDFVEVLHRLVKDKLA